MRAAWTAWTVWAVEKAGVSRAGGALWVVLVRDSFGVSEWRHLHARCVGIVLFCSSRGLGTRQPVVADTEDEHVCQPHDEHDGYAAYDAGDGYAVVVRGHGGLWRCMWIARKEKGGGGGAISKMRAEGSRNTGREGFSFEAGRTA